MKQPPGRARTAQAGRLPMVCAHVRLTAVGVPLEATEALRSAILATVEKQAELWAVRVRRRVISAEAGAELWQRYEGRAGVVSGRPLAGEVPDGQKT